MSTTHILPPPAADPLSGVEGPRPGKHIAFDPITGDYAAYYNGQLLGYRERHDQAQALADQFVYDLFHHGGAITAGELAAGAE
jgi:hypothetical protein